MNILFPILMLNALQTFADIPDREETDYCAIFGEDDIQGKKHALMTGNKVYYLSLLSGGGRSSETIGLTQPFYHDLRSRGSGIVYHEGVGTGNDFWGWGYHEKVKVAYGSIISNDMRWDTPEPSRMYWRPDKMIMEYDLSNPYLQVHSL